MANKNLVPTSITLIAYDLRISVSTNLIANTISFSPTSGFSGQVSNMRINSYTTWSLSTNGFSLLSSSGGVITLNPSTGAITANNPDNKLSLAYRSTSAFSESYDLVIVNNELKIRYRKYLKSGKLDKESYSADSLQYV